MNVATEGPFTTNQMADQQGWDLEKTRLLIKALVEDGSLTKVGEVILTPNGRRPQHVFIANGTKISQRILLHDVSAFEYLRKVDPSYLVKRGYECDRELRVDAEIYAPGMIRLFEMDRENESLRFIEKRWDVIESYLPQLRRKYGDVVVLFLTLSPLRVEKLRQRAARRPISPHILFGVFNEVIEDASRHAEVWQDTEGVWMGAFEELD